MNRADLYKDYILIYQFIGNINKQRQELSKEFELEDKIKELNKLRKQYLKDAEYIKK